MIEKAIQAIEAQQSKVQARSPQWMVGEQLKDLCRESDHNAELIYQDLQNAAMSITAAEKKIKAFADANKPKGQTFSCVTPVEADKILREFYGLEDRKAPATQSEPAAGTINLLDFL